MRAAAYYLLLSTVMSDLASFDAATLCDEVVHDMQQEIVQQREEIIASSERSGSEGLSR